MIGHPALEAIRAVIRRIVDIPQRLEVLTQHDMARRTPPQENARAEATLRKGPRQIEHRRYADTSTDEQGALYALRGEGIAQREQEAKLRTVGELREDRGARAHPCDE